MKKEPSENLNEIAYCGLFCPKCYKMKISTSAKQLLTELESAQDKGAKYLQEFPNLKSDLEKLINLECKKFCREGGGKSSICPIKKCCVERGIDGCWECSDIDDCKKLKPQFISNSKKLKKLGVKSYIKQYK
jgi:hypothetical protein